MSARLGLHIDKYNANRAFIYWIEKPSNKCSLEDCVGLHFTFQCMSNTYQIGPLNNKNLTTQ